MYRRQRSVDARELTVFFFQERFATRHELALLRISALTGLVMFGGMSGLFYTQMTGILSVSLLMRFRSLAC